MDQHSILFFSVFRNIYLYNQIFKYIRLYKDNKIKYFNNRNDLINYKEREYISSIVYTGDNPLVQGDLPFTRELKNVSFTRISGDINGDIIPDGVKHVTFPSHNTNFNTILSLLPLSVEEVTNANYTHPLDENTSISHTIKKLGFCSTFNQKITGSDRWSRSALLPNSITHLNLGERFRNGGILMVGGELPCLISNLTIHFGNYGNQLENGFLQHLNCLTHLNLSTFGQLKQGYLPISIKSLNITSLGDSFIMDRNCIPHNTINLDIKAITISLQINSFLNCQSLTKLEISRGFIGTPITKNMLPPNLKIFKFILYPNQYFYIEHGSLPNTLTHFQCDECKDYIDPSIIIQQEHGWNQIIGPEFFPQSLTYLKLPDSFNQSFEISDENNNYGAKGAPLLKHGLVLPSCLEKLILGRKFNTLIKPNHLPSSLKSLTIGVTVLSNRLQRYVMESDFYQTIEIGTFPSTITNIKISESYFHKYMIKTTGNNTSSLKVFPDSIISLIFIKNIKEFSNFNDFSHPFQKLDDSLQKIFLQAKTFKDGYHLIEELKSSNNNNNNILMLPQSIINLEIFKNTYK